MIDEIENGLHHSVVKDVWRLGRDFAQRYDVQIVATTHSDEMIVAAQTAFADAEPDLLRYHRLDRLEDGSVEAVTFDDRALTTAVKMDFDVR